MRWGIQSCYLGMTRSVLLMLKTGQLIANHINFENFVLVTIKAGVALGIGNVFAFCIKLWL